MLSGIDKLIRVSLLSVIASIVTNLVPSVVVMAQTTAPPSVHSFMFFGVINRAPNNLLGSWLIGSETIETDNTTQFDRIYGPLVIGACVQVEMRGHRTLSIISVRNSYCVRQPPKSDEPE